LLEPRLDEALVREADLVLATLGLVRLPDALVLFLRVVALGFALDLGLPTADLVDVRSLSFADRSIAARSSRVPIFPRSVSEPWRDRGSSARLAGRSMPGITPPPWRLPPGAQEAKQDRSGDDSDQHDHDDHEPALSPATAR
jgi:hypothetical protein